MPPVPHGRSGSRPGRPAGAENGRARRAWVDSDGVPDGQTWHPLTAEEGEGLRTVAAGRRRSRPWRARKDEAPEEKGGPANPPCWGAGRAREPLGG